MHDPAIGASLTVYRRAACELCDRAEAILREELEARAARGLAVPAVRTVDVSTDPALEQRYGPRVPVIVAGDEELELVTSGARIRDLLERTMPQLG